MEISYDVSRKTARSMREERHFSEIVARRVKSVFQVARRGSEEFNSGTQVYCMSHSGRVDSKNVRQNANSSWRACGIEDRTNLTVVQRNFVGHFCLVFFFLQTFSKIKSLSYLPYYDSISQNVGKRETLDI